MLPQCTVLAVACGEAPPVLGWAPPPAFAWARGLDASDATSCELPHVLAPPSVCRNGTDCTALVVLVVPAAPGGGFSGGTTAWHTAGSWRRSSAATSCFNWALSSAWAAASSSRDASGGAVRSPPAPLSCCRFSIRATRRTRRCLLASSPHKKPLSLVSRASLRSPERYPLRSAGLGADAMVIPGGGGGGADHTPAQSAPPAAPVCSPAALGLGGGGGWAHRQSSVTSGGGLVRCRHALG